MSTFTASCGWASAQAAGDAIEAMLISIDGDDVVAFPDQSTNEHRTDESSGAGDENSGSQHRRTPGSGEVAKGRVRPARMCLAEES